MYLKSKPMKKVAILAKNCCCSKHKMNEELTRKITHFSFSETTTKPMVIMIMQKKKKVLLRTIIIEGSFIIGNNKP